MNHTLPDRTEPLAPTQGTIGHRIRVAAAVIQRGDELLMTQRPPGGPLGLLWEFPGGKIEKGESPEHALVRELREELSVEAAAHEVLGVEAHDYPSGLKVEIVFIRCTIPSESFRPSAEVHAIRWMKPSDVDLSEVLAADRDFLRSLGAAG